MTLAEVFAFQGKPEAFKEYIRLDEERSILEKEIRNISNRIFDKEDSMSVFEGETDNKVYQRYAKIKKRLEEKRAKKEQEYNEIIEQMQELRRKTR